MFSIPFRLRVFSLLLCFGLVHGFDFTVTPLTECGLVRFNWVGGTPPFRALIIPPNGTIRNLSIPDTSWDDKGQSGDFSTLLPLAANASVLFSMSDATGITAGGITDLMVVGPPGAQSCNTTDPGPVFTYITDGTLSQCKPYPFTGYLETGAVLPVTILVTIPRGESFFLHPSGGSTFNWIANITTGTTVVFSMTDAQNRIGGTENLGPPVGPSDDSSCIQQLPSSVSPTRTPTPTSTSSTSTQTPASPSSPTNTNGNSSPGGNQKSNKTGAIIGGTVGGAVALLIIGLIYFLCKRRRKFGGRRVNLTEPGPGSSTSLLNPQQRGQYPPSNTYPQNGMIPQPRPGSTGVSSTTGTTHNNSPFNSTVGLDPRGMGASAAGVPMGAAAAVAMWGNQQVDPAMGTNQWGAMARQQQYPQQRYYDPYEMGSISSAARAVPAADPPPPGQQVPKSVSGGQSGVDSASNHSSSVGPTATSASGKRLSPPTQPNRRLIVHTDIEDEPIELPPMYSESRGPIAGFH